MGYKMKQTIGLIIMFIGVMIEILALLSDIRYWDCATLVFLIGVVISDLSAHQYLKKYRKKYGDIDGF